MNSDILGQCAECHYTETVPLRKNGSIEPTITFRRSDDGLVHAGCGGKVRTWTGKPYAYRVSL